jgi:hypothetical protein
MWLRINHPGYRDIEVDNEVLSQLPEDGTIISSIETHDIEPIEPNLDIGAEVNATTEANTNDEDPSPIVTTIPNLRLEL